MSTIPTIADLLGASGLVAAIAGVFGYGKLSQRIETHSRHIDRLDNLVSQNAAMHSAMAITLGRVEERIVTIRDDIHEIKNSVRRDTHE